MTLSEAIRKGSKLRPQARGDYFRISQFGEVCSCTLGGAYEAVVGFPAYNITDNGLAQIDAIEISKELEKHFPFIAERDYICCPDEHCDYLFEDHTLNGLIAHFNDDHKMSREAIAAYVESIGH